MQRSVLCLLILLLSPPTWALTLCIEDTDNPPFYIASGGEQKPGVLVEMTQLAAASLGQSLRIISHPWKRCIDKISKGEVDATLAAIWTPERDSWGAYPKLSREPQAQPDRALRLWRVQYPVFVPQSSNLGYNGQQFTGLKTGIGAPPGYIAWQRLKDQGALSEQVLLPTVGLRLVAMNRLDGYVVERNIGRYLLRTTGHEQQVKTLPTTYLEDDWFLVFSKQYQSANGALVQSLWQALGEIREQQGQAILARYMAEAGPQQ